MTEKLVAWINEQLEDHGWSRRELARRAKLSPSSVSNVISGHRKPGWDFCLRIANAFDESPIHLFQIAGLLPPDFGPLTGAELELIHQFRQLTVPEQTTARVMITLIANGAFTDLMKEANKRAISSTNE